MGRIIYGDDENNDLNQALRAHGKGRAGGIDPLADIPDLISEIGPLWWEHEKATVGGIAFKSGYGGSTRSPLIDGETLFTATAKLGVRFLRDRLSNDTTRQKAYGPGHADLLTMNWEFDTYTFAESATCGFIDYSRRELPKGTTVCVLTLSRDPVFSQPDTFHLRSYRCDNREQKSTVGYPERATALYEGWRAAYEASTGR